MLVEIKVPQLSESVAQATLLSWHKKEGDFVNRDENLIDVETDKVVLELPASASGRVKRIVKGDGAVVVSDEVIGIIDTDAKPEAVTKPATDEVPTRVPAAANEPGLATRVTPATAKVTPLPVAPRESAREPVLGPAARKLAEEQGLEREMIPATGRGGRVTKEDVMGVLRAETESRQMPGQRQDRRVPMTRLRARIAERLVEAQHTAAILTTFNEINMRPVMDLRARYRESFEKEHGVKLGFMSFFVKASVAALRKFPVVNASVEGDDIVYHEYYDIGIAVGSPRGLVVPILRDADGMGFAEVERAIGEFGLKAKDGKLVLEELTGGTFSITNGGIFGSLLSTPILNPPQSAILGMHKIEERPIAENGEVVIRPMMYVALSYDHRIVDGREAVQFLVAIKEAIEDPARLLLDL
jgi:2-oxoglutarate dehydrogenase E2 component (dihydrolipoamide succinyltransferase)